MEGSMLASAEADPPAGRFDLLDLLRLLLLIGLATFVLPYTMHGVRPAAAKSVEWANFDVTLDLQQDGSFHVVERQTVDFSGGPWFGGEREVPLARIDRVDAVAIGELVDGQTKRYQYVPPSEYDDAAGTYTYNISNSTLVIQWGLGGIFDQTRVFLVAYDVSGVLRTYPDATPPYQQISWIAVDRQLSETAPVRNASLTINLPVAVDPAKSQVQPPDDPKSHTTDGKTWHWTASDLSGGESFAVGLRFPPILDVAPPSWQASSDLAEQQAAQDSAQNSLFNLLAAGLAILLAILGGIGSYVLWSIRGRDPAVPPIDFLPQPPGDAPPGIAGALIDEQVDERDIVATLVDLGRRNVVRITEQHEDGFMGIGGSNDYKLELLQPDASLRPFEQTLLTALFGARLTQGESVELSSVKSRFASEMPQIRKEMYDELVQRGWFTQSPEATRNAWRGFAQGIVIAAIVIGFLAAGNVLSRVPLLIAPLAVVVIVGLILRGLARSMPRKTEPGAEASAKWQAFKRYLESIEKYEKLDQAKDIFDRYLPYAVAFGIEHSWVQKFASVHQPTPGWFDGVPTGGGWYGPGGYGTYGPLGRGRGPIILGQPWGAGGGAAGGGGGEGGGSNAPSIPGLPDLQGSSDAAGRSLQSASSGLFGLFNTAASVFTAASRGGGGGGFGGGGWGGGGGFGGGGGGGGSGGGGGGFH
jgi:predicted membrane protein DUF2207